MDISEIMKVLPHRYPFLLIDRVETFDPNRTLVAIKNVTINEPFFQGHFPDHPVMPGVLIIEAMAQAAALLAFKSMGTTKPEDHVVYFVGIDKARFKKPVVPGDQLTITAEIVRNLKGIWKFSVKAESGGQLASEAVLMCTMREV
ncbi:MAG: 3-hydroxyacyl-ACP dehydratase FabZ [Burkholderiales bacterium]|nr:3-hydroxyacyl-ACP dehydratase FabZ [Burkholderiales bacterium]OUT76798.1 MAG: 3-hydroxyacyl-[acyl-carrier-protein] dehydratase FabZ [Betaproteobacteria bacterium TMED22]|tara:strand:+ start:604 stop:1038 length:435 start_codon:yes stop_codon:yes gene_type:complete